MAWNKYQDIDSAGVEWRQSNIFYRDLYELLRVARGSLIDEDYPTALDSLHQVYLLVKGKIKKDAEYADKFDKISMALNGIGMSANSYIPSQQVALMQGEKARRLTLIKKALNALIGELQTDLWRHSMFVEIADEGFNSWVRRE